MSDLTAVGRAETPGLGTDDSALLDRTRTGLLVFDADSLRVTEANGWARTTLELPAHVSDYCLGDLFVGLSNANGHALLRRLRDGLVDHLIIETNQRTRDGSLRPVELRFTYSAEPEPSYLALLLDVGERSQPDDLIVRRERLRDALAEILRVLNRIDERDQLYKEACRIAVERGGFRMAWVGLVDAGSGDIVPVASAGDSIGYVDNLHLNMHRDPRGPGMTVTAIKTAQPVAIADPKVDPMFTTLKEQVLKRGFESAVSLPLIVEGHAIGALTVYGGWINAFGAIEVELLQHLADDISFKLEVIGREEQRRAVEAERDRLAAVVEQANESVIITDSEARIVYTNAAFNRLMGFAGEEVLGRSLDLFADEAAQMSATVLVGGTWNGSVRVVGKEDRPVDLHLSMSPRFDERGIVIGSIVVGLDVSREKSLEAQLVQSQKMEAIGRLAGGVAHDFNNLLTAISGYAEMLKMELGPRDERVHDVTEIQKAAARATQLTRQLLAFSRRQVLRLQPLDPLRVVMDLKPMVERLIGEDIRLVVGVPQGLGPIIGDPNQLEQVLVNLALNARDAMPGGGRLTIDAWETDMDEAFAREHLGAQPGRYVVLSVGDTGAGMTQEVLEHAFEPFFTTKGPGKGTGLGLATVLGIIEQSNGYVDVESEPGRGSRFRIYLPKAAASLEPRPEPPAIPTLPHGSGTILVVEDEAPVRMLACRILRAAGYTVLEAANGEAALALEASHPERIDLLFTDIVLPGRNGHEVAMEMRRRREGLPILFASGYDQEIIAAKGMLEEASCYLSKPYRIEDMLAQVRELVAIGKS